MNSLLLNLNLVFGARPIADFTTGVGGTIGGRVGSVIGAGVRSAIGGMIGRGIESIWDSNKSGNDYGDGTSY